MCEKAPGARLPDVTQVQDPRLYLTRGWGLEFSRKNTRARLVGSEGTQEGGREALFC